MSRSHLNQPNPAIERLYREADEAWGRQDYQKGISLIERVAHKEPFNPLRLLDLARAYGRRYDFPAAEGYVEKALQISKDRAHTLGEAGRICLELDELDLAVAYLARASQKKGVSVASLITLADLYLRDQRIDEAAELVARAAQMDRKDPRVLLAEAMLTRLRGNLQEAKPLLRQLLTNPAAVVHVRVRAAYELAGILDGEAQYDEAMVALLEAKAILRPYAGPHAATVQHMQNRAKEMEQTITTAVMDRWRAEAARLQPPRRIALLCGHPRSGTTLLEQVLDAHSDVISAEETKLMHDEAYLPLIRDFPEGTSIIQALDSVPPSLLCHARENYFHCAELLLRAKIGGRLLLDKNPALNLMIPMVVRVFPETKFLVALRDPRDVIVSCFMQALPLTPISSSYHSIEGTVNQYANVMGFWLEMLPRMGDQWRYVRYEEMVDDLASVARSVLGFLGMGFEDNVLKFYEHASAKRVRSPSHADVKRPLYRTAVGRWRNYQKYLDPYMTRLEPFIKAFNYA
ncbi:MAG TPA: sulfotransferase [Candidatus Binatia bacterium]|jgi:tetratricopeptide (TPR) repeat protein|nr:sulfotransferase [Candidatus Binatia bacterium]